MHLHAFASFPSNHTDTSARSVVEGHWRRMILYLANVLVDQVTFNSSTRLSESLILRNEQHVMTSL